tara:strand:+ start:705 stop:1961 length:1257 start_codon:yes stop_codon:yes gene_type:complete
MNELIKINFEKVAKTLNLSKENIDLRKKSLSQFIKNGFPNKKKEDWKFSDLNAIISKEIKELKYFDEDLIEEKAQKIPLDKFPNHITRNNFILLVNGCVKQINLNHENMKNIEIINSINNKIYETKNTLISLNNALTPDYLKIIVKENYNFKRPLILFNISNNKINSTNINQRFDIVLEKNASMSFLNLFEDYSQNNFININHQFKLNEGAILKNYKIDYKENSNIKYFYNNIDLDKNSISENFILSYGSKFIKNEIICNLKDEYSSAFVNGIINLDQSKHHEIRTQINHISENSKSYQLIKSVLKDKAKAIYQGKIYVDSKAQKTDGYQLSKAILLNEGTEFNGKPELEIYADDVKCSHGSASGNLDENKIFYLMTRGLNYQEAKELLIEGFLLDVIEKITDIEIKEIIKEIIGFKS